MKIKPPFDPLLEKRLKYQALIAQASYLRSPARAVGASVYEAEEVARGLEREAEDIEEKLFEEGLPRTL